MKLDLLVLSDKRISFEKLKDPLIRVGPFFVLSLAVKQLVDKLMIIIKAHSINWISAAVPKTADSRSSRDVPVNKLSYPSSRRGGIANPVDVRNDPTQAHILLRAL